MKRWLITLVVLLLSVQTAVAAVCQYCEHMEHAAGVHSLAAEPEETVDPRLDVQHDPVQALSIDTCSVCHLSNSSIPTQPAPLHAPLQARQPPPDPATLYNPTHVERIQRVPLLLPASS
ncbi:MAG: hypothetical protein U5L03_01900 [Burkholderiaceae bacterium]|nr:hypothetical protein [Burkholderiaceae bacterium]